MLFYSIGSAIGAIASTAVYDSAGWNGVCILGTAISIVAVIFWAVTAHIGRAQLQATLTASQLKTRI
ncbi:hypothetical protein [Shewanella baltica]|uniref:hypothetical protein n=1 Tax=Shewanella baltica TaxID=62322 RepID=UPI00217D3601|nr:hypothetical protein [Shewanella baltica]